VYGLIGKIVAVEGRRNDLADLLAAMGADMPGCLSYVVHLDAVDADGLWITEIWESAAAHEASLDVPEVQTAIERGRPLIARFEQRIETVPLVSDF
jgi:quinol monooxygenase YgiN